MPKSKGNKSASNLGIPNAPWIYITAPSGLLHSQELAALIPNVLHCVLSPATFAAGLKIGKKERSSVILFTDSQNDHNIQPKIVNSRHIKECAIKANANFASINIMGDISSVSEVDSFGTNHLNIAAAPDIATKIYKWLFTVFSVRETLYLIPEAQMKQTGDKLFPNYTYCPVNEVSQHPKDAKIQIVALVVSKPQIVGGNKLTWSVADHTGVANFYFQWRGPSSQYTWDWVLKMCVGNRRALPRMPYVEIKEKKRMRLVKAPLRATGAVIGGTGSVITAVGRGVCKVGKAMQMGPSSQWVAEIDIGPDGKKVDWSKMDESPVKVQEPAEKKIIEVFNEKGQKNWSDGASVASTDIGSEVDEKTGKEFV